MEDFEPMQDFFQLRQAKILTEHSAGVRLVTLREGVIRDCFAFPGIEYDSGVEADGQHVGRISYEINPLTDRVYIYEFIIKHQHQLTGTGISVLWWLWCKYQMSLVLMSEYGTSIGFWSKARERLAAAGVEIKRNIRAADQEEEKFRWQHLVPQSEHERTMRQYLEWVATEYAEGRPAGPGIR